MILSLVWACAFNASPMIQVRTHTSVMVFIFATSREIFSHQVRCDLDTSGRRNVDLNSASAALRQLVSAHRNTSIRNAQPDIVLMQRDLTVAGTPRALAVKHFSHFMDLLPPQEPSFDRFKYIALLVLNNRFPHVDHDHVGPLHRFIIHLAAPLLEP